MHRVKVTLGAALLVGMSLPMEPALLPHSTEALAVVGSEEGRVVAEAWKVLDRAFVDSNFNGVDWRAVSFELHTLRVALSSAQCSGFNPSSTSV